MRHRERYACVSIFSKIGLVDQSKPCTKKNYLQFFLMGINLQLVIRISKNYAFRTCTAPSRTEFSPILRSIGLLDIKIPQKVIISTDYRRTDRRHDKRTDGQTDGRTDVAYDNNR